MARFSLKRTAAVARLEGLQLVRDRSALMLIVLLPIMQLLLYGYAVNLFPDHTRLAIAGDNPIAVAQAARAARKGGAFDILGGAGLPGSAETAVRDGRASLGLEIDTTPFGTGVMTIFADGADPATARPALALLEAGVLRGRDQASETPVDPVGVKWLNAPGGGASWAATPGLVGVIVMVSMLFLGAMTLVRERERGTWETLLATPVRPAEALIGKLSPYLAVGDDRGGDPAGRHPRPLQRSAAAGELGSDIDDPAVRCVISGVRLLLFRRRAEPAAGGSRRRRCLPAFVASLRVLVSI